MIRKMCCIALLALTYSAPSIAADFSWETNEYGNRQLAFRGPIEQGDAQRLLGFLAFGNGCQNECRLDIYNYLRAGSIALDSPGGSVSEAIKIANYVEQSGLSVFVPANAICASACFLIYVSAPIRVSAGEVIVHRPYFDMTKMTGGEQARYSRAYQEASSESRQFLLARSVPSDLIDKMMETPSASGYVLTPYDHDRIGVLSPAVEEYVLQRCGASLRSDTDIAPVMECARPLLSDMKSYFVARQLNYGSEQGSPDEVAAGIIAMGGVISRLAEDPAFERKLPVLRQQIEQIKLLKPSQWAKELESFYWSIE